MKIIRVDFSQDKDVFSDLFPMVMHFKKPSPKKKRSPKEGASDAVLAKAEPSANAMPEPMPATPEPTVMPIAAAKPEEPTPAVPLKILPDAVPMVGADAAEERDYGLGIGDILGSEDAIDLSNVVSDDGLGPTVDAKSASHRSIEFILNRGNTPVKPPRQRSAPPSASSGNVLKRVSSKTAILLIVSVLLFAAAVAGIFMFVRKNGLLKSPFTAIPGQGAKVTASNTLEAATAPRSVSATVLVSADPPKDTSLPAVATRVVETDVKLTGTFPATGEGKASAPGRSTGRATIINDTSKSYVFVATTRLLSKDGVLFRMKSPSPIPAGGSVTVDVYADEPGSGGDIGATVFTIPGLPPALQKDIYAKSGASMSGGSARSKSKTVTQDDIDAAKKSLVDKLKKEADANFGSIVQDGETFLPELVTLSELSSTAPKPGAAGKDFSVILSLRFRTLVVPEKAVLSLLLKAMADTLPAGAVAADYTLGKIIYTVQAYPSTEEAQVRAEAAVIKK